MFFFQLWGRGFLKERGKNLPCDYSKLIKTKYYLTLKLTEMALNSYSIGQRTMNEFRWIQKSELKLRYLNGFVLSDYEVLISKHFVFTFAELNNLHIGLTIRFVWVFPYILWTFGPTQQIIAQWIKWQQKKEQRVIIWIMDV